MKDNYWIYYLNFWRADKLLTSNLIFCGLNALFEFRSLLIQIGFPSKSIIIGTIPDTITELSSIFGPEGEASAGPELEASAGSEVEAAVGPEASIGSESEAVGSKSEASIGTELEASVANFSTSNLLLYFELPVILKR